MKKGQLTIFFLIGIAIVVIITMVTSNIAKDRRLIVQQQDQVVNLEAQKESVRNYVNACLKDLFLEKQGHVLLNQANADEFSTHIEENLIDFTGSGSGCVDIPFLESGGVEISANNDMQVDVEITDDAAIVRVDWTIRINKGGDEVTVSEFNFFFPRSFTIDAPFTEEGMMIDDIRFSSPDNDLVINIPRGTFASPECRDGITVKLVDPAEEGASICKVSYMLGPEDCSFDPPAEIHFTYPTKNIEGSVTTTNLLDEITMGVYDETAGKWYVVPCFTDNDNEEIVCYFRHLGHFSCIESTQAEIEPGSVTEVTEQCDKFAALSDGAGLPCICGNNIIYWAASDDPFYCVPDDASKVYDWVDGTDYLDIEENILNFSRDFGIDQVSAMILLNKIYIYKETPDFLPTRPTKEQVISSIDSYMSSFLDFEEVSYVECLYHGKEYTRSELVAIARGEKVPPSGFSSDLRKWRPDSIPCKCGDRFYVHSPPLEEDPFICFNG